MAACIDDDQPPPSFKHYCRVCKKGFMCGRALGGHMRAHGIGDENGALDDDDEDDDDNSDWEDRSTTNCKRMYQLRTNPNRLKSCRTCENCGKKFLSWKSFLEHENLGKCTSDDSDDASEEKRWSKRKRSLRSKVGSEDDLLLATCLVQLANTTVDLPLAEPEESCAKSRAATKGLFECKACKKVFNSHQALGGHRASHKKVKGCYAAKQDEPDDNNNNLDVANNDQEFPSYKPTFQFEQPLVGAGRRKSKVHECSICHRVFNSGQALGGHKRCHWIISNSPETSSMPKFQFQLQDHNVDPLQNHKPIINAQVSEKLDLNVPAWAQMAGVRRDPQNPLSFDVSTETNLRAAWVGKGGNTMNGDGKMNKEKNGSDQKEKEKGEGEGEGEGEADSKLKLAKLSVLNDTNVGTASQWLQVGISSATEAAAAAAAGGDE